MEAVRHKGTAQVVAVVAQLANHGGWMAAAEISAALDLHRDTTRLVLGELVHHGWVQHRPADDLYCLGAELPRLGLATHNRLVQQARTLRAELDQLTRPLETP